MFDSLSNNKLFFLMFRNKQNARVCGVCGGGGAFTSCVLTARVKKNIAPAAVAAAVFM